MNIYLDVFPFYTTRRLMDCMLWIKLYLLIVIDARLEFQGPRILIVVVLCETLCDSAAADKVVLTSYKPPRLLFTEHLVLCN